MEILLVPNELLRQKANRLINITSEDIKIANQMMDTMIKAPGVGLAANQVGILKQIITINFEDKENDKRANYILFNPSIIEYSEEKVIMEEGCLSLPEQYANIERPKQIFLEYIDENEKTHLITRFERDKEEYSYTNIPIEGGYFLNKTVAPKFPQSVLLQ